VVRSASQLQKSFGQCIRDERKGRALSQEKLAELAEISLTYAGEIERGEKMPSLEIIVRLAEAFGLTGAQLLERSGL
jgi:transcriptional regulator with XRE-family HTH domain